MGSKIYPNTRIHKVTDGYIGRCITRDNMTALQNDLTALYIDRKYALARVYFDQKRSKLTNGDSDVVFIVEEGMMNKVEFRDEYDGEEYQEPVGWWLKWRNAAKKYTDVPGADLEYPAARADGFIIYERRRRLVGKQRAGADANRDIR
ncbi:MAG: hypothetical protein LBF28_01500 [Rickettsiales bacterium]|nr:hypothetical protein [Rickettsiales bacterium]